MSTAATGKSDCRTSIFEARRVWASVTIPVRAHVRQTTDARPASRADLTSPLKREERVDQDVTTQGTGPGHSSPKAITNGRYLARRVKLELPNCQVKTTLTETPMLSHGEVLDG